MKKIKTLMLSAILSIACLFLSQIKASASIWVCWNGDPCFETEGSCDGWCSGSNGQPTCSDCGIATNFFNPNLDYIVTSSTGEAWVFHEGKLTRIASDGLAALSKQLLAKYGSHNSDKKIQQIIDKAYADFFKTDNHKVSAKRVALNSKETGLKIRKIPDNASNGIIKIGTRSRNCTSGFGICHIRLKSPDKMEAREVAASFKFNSKKLTVQFRSALPDKGSTLTIDQDIFLDKESSQKFGFDFLAIKKGDYNIDFTNNKFGFVNLIATNEYTEYELNGDEFMIIDCVSKPELEQGHFKHQIGESTLTHSSAASTASGVKIDKINLDQTDYTVIFLDGKNKGGSGEHRSFWHWIRGTYVVDKCPKW